MQNASSRILLVKTIIIFTFISLFLTTNVFAGKISKTEKKTYMDLSLNIPKDASFNFLANDIGMSMSKIDAVLKQYQQEDPSFKYHQLILSFKGSLGYNPFSVEDLKIMGLDVKYGLFAFALGQDGTPIIGFRANDIEKAKSSLDNLVKNLGQLKRCPETNGKGFKAYYFTQDGTNHTPAMIAYAISKNMVYLMVAPPSPKWFEAHVEASVGLARKKSLATDKHFGKLINRIQSNTSVVFYNNFNSYLKELKKGADRLGKQLTKNQANNTNQSPPMIMMNSALKMAESFDAQIFAVAVNDGKASFVHEVIGSKKAIAKHKKFFSASTNKFKNLPLANSPIGYITAKLNLKSFYNHISKQSPEAKAQFDIWNKQLIEKTGVDFKKDIISNLTGEMAGLFYGMEMIPSELATGTSVSGSQLANLGRLVFLAGLKNTKASIKLLNKTAESQIALGKKVTSKKQAGFDVLWSVEVDGITLQYGIRKNLFVMGFGETSITTAFGSSEGMDLYGKKTEISNLSFDFTRFVETMKNLAPPADSPNTQLYQQYMMWNNQIAPKLGFLNKLQIKSFFIKDGFRTEGELAF